MDSEWETDLTRPTLRALEQCSQWLSYCLKIGWKKDQLDELESLWWQYHNFNGSLKGVS